MNDLSVIINMVLLISSNQLAVDALKRVGKLCPQLS